MEVSVEYLSSCWNVWFGPIECFLSILLAGHKLNYKTMLEKKCEWNKNKHYFVHENFQQPLLISIMHMKIKSLWLALLLEPILLTGVKIPHNKGRHCPFRKSQLDPRMFGMAGSTGLWTHDHIKFGWVDLNLNNIRMSHEKNYSILPNYSILN